MLLLWLLGVLSLLWSPVPSHTFWWKAVTNFGHVPLFALVAMLLLKAARIWIHTAGWATIRHYLFALVGALGFAIVTEVLQALIGTRHSEVSDVAHDLFGATCALGWSLTYDQWVSGKLA